MKYKLAHKSPKKKASPALTFVYANERADENRIINQKTEMPFS